MSTRSTLLVGALGLYALVATTLCILSFTGLFAPATAPAPQDQPLKMEDLNANEKVELIERLIAVTKEEAARAGDRKHQLHLALLAHSMERKLQAFLKAEQISLIEAEVRSLKRLPETRQDQLDGMEQQITQLRTEKALLEKLVDVVRKVLPPKLQEMLDEIAP